MQFNFKDDSDTVIIVIDEPALHDGQARDLSDKVAYFIKQGKSKFIVDLQGLRILNSRAVGAFVMCRTRAIREGGDLILVHVHEHVMNLMGIAHLTPVFTIVQTMDEAVEKLKAKKKDKAG